jgi:hypothetical protein
VVLLAAAVWMVWRNTHEVQRAWQSVRGAPPWRLALFVTLPLLSWVFTSILFVVLTRRHGRVGLREMLALIGSSWLLNYLPMRPGLLGRVAYHKAVNGIAVRHSAGTIVWAVVCTVVAAAAMAAFAFALPRAGSPAPLAMGLAVPLLICGAAAWWLRARDAAGLAWRLVAALGLRYADLLVQTGRYLLAFSLIGKPIGVSDAVTICAAAQAAQVSPVVFGVREWIVGVFSGAVETGLKADLLNRAAEVAVALPVGLVASWWLWRRQPARLQPPGGATAVTGRGTVSGGGGGPGLA